MCGAWWSTCSDRIFFCITNFFLSASVGFCGLTAIIRAFRGEKTVGSFFVDVWRVVVYMFRSDILLHYQLFPFGVGRLLWAHGDNPRLPGREDSRQFLRRCVARGGLHVPIGYSSALPTFSFRRRSAFVGSRR